MVTNIQFQYEQDFIQKGMECQPYTMVDVVRMYTLYKAVHHVVQHRVPGDFVECGVWKGGCCMLMALTLRDLKAMDRPIWLYDTFTGMTEPGPNDVKHNGDNPHPE